MRATSVAVGFAAWLALGCAREPVDLPAVSGDPWTVEWWVLREQPVFVLAIDDGVSAAADELRRVIATSFRSAATGWLQERQTPLGGYPFDPASDHPGDAHVLVIRPSAPVGRALVSPLEVPGLAWTSLHSTAVEAAAWADAVAQALEPASPYRGARHALLERVHSVVELVDGQRAPATPDEHALVDGLPAHRRVRLALATTKDDESAGEPESYVLGSPLLYDLVLVPDADESCGQPPWAPPRLGQWLDAHEVRPPVWGWPCSDPFEYEGALWPHHGDGSYACLDEELVIGPDGQAECRITIETPDLDGCPAERGWADPNGVPTFTARDGITHRRCEIRQLGGAALEACRSTLACPGCGSGWCATEVAEVLAPVCPGHEHPNPLRFVGGAVAGAHGWVSIVCNTVAPG